VELLLMELAATWSKLTAPSEKKKSELETSPSPQAEKSETRIASPVEEKSESPKPAVPEKPIISAPKPATPTPSSAVADAKEDSSKPKLTTPLKRKASFSISQTLEGKNPLAKKEGDEEEEDLDAPVVGKPQDAFDLEQLQKVWQLFLEKAKADRQRVTLATLSDKPLTVDGPKVTLTLDNNIQEQSFEAIKRDLLYFLREKLNNYALNISVQIVEGTQKLEPYSPQEKYQYLLAKNPLLEQLRTDLNLEIK